MHAQFLPSVMRRLVLNGARVLPVIAAAGALISSSGHVATQNDGCPVTTAIQWSVGYWTPYGNPAVPISEIQWDGLTHVVQWGALVQPDGTLDLTTNQFAANATPLIAAAREANVKVLVGITQAYWRGETTGFRSAVNKDLSGFAGHVLKVVDTYGFDGVDLDWEPFNSSADGKAMVDLMGVLRQRLGAKILTAAVIITDYRFWGSAHSRLDRVNVMTYDMTGTWDPYAWHNSALFADTSDVWSVDLAVQRYLSAGVPTEKLGIGIPFFGWEWTHGGISGPKQKWRTKPELKQIAYHSFHSRISSETYRWDFEARVPFLLNPPDAPGYLSYDNEESIAEKIRFAKRKGLGGWIIWALDQDYFPDRTPRHPLMTAVRDAMNFPAQTTEVKK